MKQKIILTTLLAVFTVTGVAGVTFKPGVNIVQDCNNASLEFNQSFTFDQVNTSCTDTKFRNGTDTVTVQSTINSTKNFRVLIQDFNWLKGLVKFKIFHPSTELVNALVANGGGLLLGLGVLAFMVLKTSREFKEAETMEQEAINLLSILFLIGLEYAGYGIAVSEGLTKASDAYLVATMVTSVVFLLLVVKMVHSYWVKTREADNKGFDTFTP